MEQSDPMSQFPILSGGFLLIQGGVSPENVACFAKCFSQAWDHLPPEDQQKIQAHYFRRANVALQGHVANTKDGLMAAGDDKSSFLMRGDSLVIFDFPEEQLTLAIGEELAHAFLIASRDPTHVPILRDGHEEAAQAQRL